MSGYLRSYRDKWDHPVFRNYQEVGVWAWLCDKTFWKAGQKRFNGVLVNLNRGQWVTSTRFISENFNLTERATRTLLENLEKEEMIVTQTTNKLTIITICNYDKYQLTKEADDTQTDEQPPNERQADDTPIKKEGSKVIKESKKTRARDALADVELEFKNEFWPLCGKKLDEPEALRAYRRARKAVEKATILDGMRRYSSEREGQDPQYTRSPARWLNAGSWANGTETPTAPSTPITFDAEWKTDAMRIGNIDPVIGKLNLEKLNLVVDGKYARLFAVNQPHRDYVENKIGDSIRLAVQKIHPTVIDFEFLIKRTPTAGEVA